MKKAVYFTIAIALISLILFCSCVLAPSATEITSSDESLKLTDIDPMTLDPALCNDLGSAGYIIQIFSGLLRLDDNMEPIPDIAESMPEVSADGLTYNFKLRQNVKFQDGKAVTAADFKYSWERAADPATHSLTAGLYLNDIVGVNDMLNGKADQIAGVKVIDDYTLQVNIDSPESYFLYKLTYPTTFVVEKSNVSTGSEWWRKPVGTGPFQLINWQKQASLTLQRNELYYGVKAKIKQVSFIYNSTSSDMDLYETDQIDLVGVSTLYYDKVMDKSGPFYNDLLVSPSLSVSYIGFNCVQPPFNDVNVRRAFNLAIDKEKIVTLVYRDMVQKANGILPPGLPGYNQNIQGYSFDVNQARELIKSSSYGDVSKLPSITLTIGGEGGNVGPIIESLIFQWKQNFGVDVKIRQLEPELYNTGLAQELDQMFYFGWIADYPHPQDFLDILFSTGSNNNYGNFSDSEVDSLIHQANHELNQTGSFALYQQAEQKMVNDAACLPLVFDKNYILVQPYVKGLNINALGFIYYNQVTIVPH